jgi:DNA-directed RNA polymerase subunit M/transcription elongation factor TFIIS
MNICDNCQGSVVTEFNNNKFIKHCSKCNKQFALSNSDRILLINDKSSKDTNMLSIVKNAAYNKLYKEDESVSCDNCDNPKTKFVNLVDEKNKIKEFNMFWVCCECKHIKKLDK